MLCMYYPFEHFVKAFKYAFVVNLLWDDLLSIMGCMVSNNRFTRWGQSCYRRDLSDWTSLIYSNEQLRLASVEVVEAICGWRLDEQAARIQSAPHSSNRGKLKTPRAHDRALSRDPHHGGDKNKISSGLQGILLQSSALESQEEGVDPLENAKLTHHLGDGDQEQGLTDQLRGNSSGTPRKHRLEEGSEKAGRCSIDVGAGSCVAKGRWVVTMMVPGRKLWGASPAMVSQYKRFRRSRQEPKIARDQVKNTLSSCVFSLRRKKLPYETKLEFFERHRRDYLRFE